MNGAHQEGIPTTIEPRQAELEALHAEVFGKTSNDGLPKEPKKPLKPEHYSTGNLSDDDLIAKICASKVGNKFRDLFYLGNEWAEMLRQKYGYASQSEADLALCGFFAFWTGKDAAWMDRLFRRSKLMREKWDEFRGTKTYGQITIDEAIASTTETWKGAKRNRNRKPPKAKSPDGPKIDTTKPIIPITDRYLDSISNDAIKALETANHPPFLFRRSGSLVRISLDEKNTPKIIVLNDVQLRGVLARNALFLKQTKAGSFPTSPPIDAVKDILHLGDWTFPALEGIVQSPVMRPDGTILVEPGYDPNTHLYYVKPADLLMPEIPVNPSVSDVEGYLGYLLDAIRDFPFVEDSDRANALALIMTLPLRPAIAGSVPMAAITKPTPGTGASLFVDIVAIIGTGKVAPMAGLPRDDDEMRKFITSRLLAGDPLISFDNLELPLWGPSLSRALTCHEWEDRILGGNTTARLPQRAVWVANGNNLKLRGDLPRRTFPIRFDAKLAKPWERENFNHSDLRSWCRRWRGDLLVSILSIGRAWYAAGKPEPQRQVPVLGGFEAWAQTIGGILSFAGVEGFLENLAQFHSESDLEGPEWESFLSAWVEIIGDTPKTCQEVAAIIRQNPGFASTLPENLQDILNNPEKSFERSLGRALARKEKRPYGEKSLALKRDRITRDKVILWKVAPL